MSQPVNVYGTTEVYDNNKLLNCVYDGFGYRDSSGNITWYGCYNPPKDDAFHSTLSFHMETAKTFRKCKRRTKIIKEYYCIVVLFFMFQDDKFSYFLPYVLFSLYQRKEKNENEENKI